jgi:hypothetical protein
VTGTVDAADRVYSALAATGRTLQAEFDLPDRYTYAPTDEGEPGFTPVYLVVHDETGGRSTRERQPVISEGGSITLYPTGSALLDASEEFGVTELAADPVELGNQLSEAVVSGLELADSVDTTVDASAGTATVTVRRPRFAPATGFDHPTASVFAVGFAHGLDRAVTMAAEAAPDGQTYRVTCRWNLEAT